ncbi:MAG: InlB B-repeat-containing protein [Clostridia bacterium]|nr:InlB B-repeat-containing protein [Clostridia bacterium]
MTSFEKHEYKQTGEEATPTPTVPAGSLSRSGDDTDYVYIRIKYLDHASSTPGNDHSIYTDYVAQIEKGTPFKNNVVSPSFLGFAPYYDADGDGEADEDAKTIPFNLDAVNEDITIRVYYKAVNVPFAVRFYFQNINDDFYTEQSDLYWVGSALTGTIIEEKTLKEPVAAKSVGLAMMYHIPEAVAADGSTVFECYYDRLYSLLQFDNNGGYGVDPIYARYGAAFVVNDPVKHGYEFVGWDDVTANAAGDGIADVLPSTIPSENRNYRAIWREIETEYTVAYWLDDGYGNYSILKTREVGALSASIVSGSDDMGGMRDGKDCNLIEHAHSASCCTLHQHSSDCCSILEHTHGGADCDCTLEEHTHTATGCWPNVGSAATPSNAPTNNLYDGRIYRRGNYNNYYYYVYIYGQWYNYEGTVQNYNNGSTKITRTCAKDEHTHGDGNCTCAKLEHDHTSGCNTDYCDYDYNHTHGIGSCTCPLPTHTHTSACGDTLLKSYYEFDKADQNVVVEGDGSTVVNVYYKVKMYTLRFYYARSSGTGNNAKYEVVGGTTYPFGTYNSANENTSVEQLLSYVSEWGTVNALPQVSESYKSRYTFGQLESIANGYTYHYIEFKAPYGSYLEQLWPIGIFDSVKIVGTHSQCSYQYAYFSAWNGEYKVKYTQDNSYKFHNGNETIKGCYMYLDEDIIYRSDFDEITLSDGSSLVNFLGFWDNGANISWSVPKMFVYNLWIESLETPGTYELYKTFTTYDDSTVGKQTVPPLDGYTFDSARWEMAKNDTAPYQNDVVEDSVTVETDKSMTRTTMNMYYDRNTNLTLTFTNYGNDELFSNSVPFGTALADIYDKASNPPYPSVLEQNAYSFEGWYTTAECYANSKFELSTETMPSSNLMLFANWVPEKHTVTFFKTLDELKEYEAGTFTGTPFAVRENITHGNVVGSIEHPTRAGDGDTPLVFTGWFYLENGSKKAFDPLNMPVKKDLNIFADWSSQSPEPYLIHYVLKSDPTIKVADDSFGYAYAGSTRTFMAKTGNPSNQLYAEYADGYFPTVASHSITMEFEEDQAHPVHNVFTFEYVFAENISYTVRYLDKQTNLPVHDEKSGTTNSSVITERFEAVENMIPDAFYKRLVIAVIEDPNNPNHYIGSPDNVVTFYYTPNTESAYYAVHFMMQKLNADGTVGDPDDYKTDGSGGYESSGSHIEGIADIDAQITINPQTFAGFNVDEDHAIVVMNGTQSAATKIGDEFQITITAEGTELFIFYQRKQVDYTVHYYENGTTNSIASSKTVSGSYFGSTVPETAIDIPGYTCISEKMKTLTIQEDESSNVITFYYALKEYVAQYVCVPDVGGTLSQTIEVILGDTDPLGSTPTANKNYEFVGWFLDEACTIPVTAEHGDLDGNTFKPSKEKMKANGEGDNIYYAKFRLLAGDLTIVRQGASDNTQMFVYKVTNETDLTIWVTIMGNGSTTIHDLPFGNYTITQENDWSWRYGDPGFPGLSFTHDGTNEATFNYNSRNQWLTGNSVIGKDEAGGT